MNTICPLQLATKLQWIRNREDNQIWQMLQARPRIVEALRFIQWASHQPGGLDELAQRLIHMFPEKFITKPMREAGEAQNGRWSLKQCLIVWPKAARDNLGWNLREHRWDRDFVEWWMAAAGDHYKDKDLTVESLRSQRVSFEPLKVGLEKYNYEFFHEACLQKACEELASRLAGYCLPDKALYEPWYCASLFDALFDYMDQHAAEVALGLADTEVKRIVFRELAFSMSERVPVQIVGNSRFGKTKAISIKCAMHPGLARLVTVTPGCAMRDLFDAHARAFYYAPSRSTSCGELERDIKFIVREFGAFLIYDESQFCLPPTYGKNTKARRLDWIRSNVIDPLDSAKCAFFATAQTYQKDLKTFVEKTGYVMEQWLGRMAPVVTLPEDVDRDDLLAVARLNFTDIKPAFLKLIAARAMQSEGLLHHIEITAKRARFIARESGRAEPTQDDVQSAIAHMMPSTAKHAPVRSASPADAPQPKGNAAANTAPRQAPAIAVHNRLSASPDLALAEV